MKRPKYRVGLLPHGRTKLYKRTLN